ncbi:MAG TPA: phytanoyl-CoA dioxygenase family protein, partial [Thermoanaerobaculia bacterium]|nr:phytanoyl-CoA dioxygenase family protein [Thermoanaerobaculia bacterium]
MHRDLSQADLRQFHDDGYLIVEGLFARHEVAAMAAAAERLRAVGRELAAALAAEADDAPGERKLEHRGSQ